MLRIAKRVLLPAIAVWWASVVLRRVFEVLLSLVVGCMLYHNAVTVSGPISLWAVKGLVIVCIVPPL